MSLLYMTMLKLVVKKGSLYTKCLNNGNSLNQNSRNNGSDNGSLVSLIDAWNRCNGGGRWYHVTIEIIVVMGIMYWWPFSLTCSC